MEIYFRTLHDAYRVNELGQIKRLDQPDFRPSDGWKMLGIQHVKRNAFIPFAELIAGRIPEPLLYKNGKPQWTVRDLDHGTTRVWGNTAHHGVSGIHVIA